MSSAMARAPLGDATTTALNVGHVTAKHSAESLERKLKRALASDAKQRRKRAEAEGAAEAAQKEVSRLKTKLERSSEANKQTSSSSKDSQMDKLQKQFDDLLKRYHDSRTRYHSQIADLQKRNRELESAKANTGPDAGPSAPTRVDKETGAIEKLEAGNTRLTAKVEQLEQRGESYTEASGDYSSIETERDVLLDQIQQASIAYGTLYRRSVDRAYAQQLSEELALERNARIAAEASLALALEENEGLRAELDDRKSAEQMSRSELAMAQEQIQCMRVREAESSSAVAMTRLEVPMSIPPLEASDGVSRLLDLAISHIELLQCDTSSQIAQLLKSNAEMTASTDSALHAAAATHAELVALRSTTADLQSRYTALETAHAACSSAIDELRGKWKKSEAEVMRVKVLMHEAERKVADLEARNQADKEVLKRAVDTASRARMAEEALDQDIADLREALAAKAPFEPLYHALKEEHEILLSRQGMTLEELDRMGEINAELVRGGEDGKIGYIEGIRRDMAIVKQELATTRHRLNTANDRIVDLETELEAFKCIDQPVMGGPGVSGRTRVVRRQPEGSAVLTTSTAGGIGRRSVSSSLARSGR